MSQSGRHFSTPHAGRAAALRWSVGQQTSSRIDLEYDEARFEDDDMRDHRILHGVSVFGDIEIFEPAARIGQETANARQRLYGTHFVAIMLSVLMVTSGNSRLPSRDAGGRALRLAHILRTNPPRLRTRIHRIRTLEIRQRATFSGVIGQLVIGKYRAG